MNNYEQLIDQLRTTKSRSKRALLDMATDAIENLLRSNEASQDIINKQSDFADRLVADVLRQDEQIGQLTDERNALLRDLKDADVDCSWCRSNGTAPDDCAIECVTRLLDCRCQTCRNNSNWEWRGIVEGGA